MATSNLPFSILFSAMNLTSLFTLVSIAYAIPFSGGDNHLGGGHQDHFAVTGLPDSPHGLPPSWAGSIGIPGSSGGDSLFFWLFEAESKAVSNDLISTSSSQDKPTAAILMETSLA